jgi:hypothetical protein
MIKKILLFSGIIFMIQASSYGQACTADPQYTNTTTQKGAHPDTIINLAPAYVGKPYSQTLTLVFPTDTTIAPFGALAWDSTVVTGYAGLPTSLTPACWNKGSKPNRCSWTGNSIGCSIITGTPLAGDIGTHLLTVNTNNYLAGTGTAQAYAIKGYKIIVSMPTGIDEETNSQTLLQNNPNPFSDKTEILFTSNEPGSAAFRIYDMIGKMVYQSTVNVENGTNKIEVNAKDFESGIYFYTIIYHNNSFTRKMVISK